ncbi:helix-turn-helix transcriptional regulator [Streptococcus canis]|uniref:helix-turn-helix domain-containing protein n=1 Tax=Streptococcus canis TaxID=1329 RepID=UPI00294A0D92|nr:helix-turn-helix transcriptional regulator [Streptococcus canis]MDV5987558.1 helix-turn-helix transcriptional regulator [Streptococcus canis]
MIENFAPNLIKLRKQKGLSQKELAQNIGVSSQTISNIENQSAYPTFTNLEKIAQFFNATPTQLFGTTQEIELERAVLQTDEYDDKIISMLNALKEIDEYFDKNEEKINLFINFSSKHFDGLLGNIDEKE